MPNKTNKKIPISASPQDPALEKRVDDMMATIPSSQPPSETLVNSSITPQDKLPPLDIFKYHNDQLTNLAPTISAPALSIIPSSSPTAPVVPSSLLKQLARNDRHSNNLTILKPVSDSKKTQYNKSSSEADLDHPKPSLSVAVDSSIETVSQQLPDPLEQPGVVTREIDDRKSDQAVDEIIAYESDQILAAEDLLSANPGLVVPRAELNKNVGVDNQSFWSTRKKWVVFIILVALIVATVILLSRYKLLGQVLSGPK